MASWRNDRATRNWGRLRGRSDSRFVLIPGPVLEECCHRPLFWGSRCDAGLAKASCRAKSTEISLPQPMSGSFCAWMGAERLCGLLPPPVSGRRGRHNVDSPGDLSGRAGMPPIDSCCATKDIIHGGLPCARALASPCQTAPSLSSQRVLSRVMGCGFSCNPGAVRPMADVAKRTSAKGQARSDGWPEVPSSFACNAHGSNTPTALSSEDSRQPLLPRYSTTTVSLVFSCALPLTPLHRHPGHVPPALLSLMSASKCC